MSIISFNEIGCFEIQDPELIAQIAGGLSVRVDVPYQIYSSSEYSLLRSTYLPGGTIQEVNIPPEGLGLPSVLYGTGVNVACWQPNLNGVCAPTQGDVNAGCANNFSGTNAGCFNNISC